MALISNISVAKKLNFSLLIILISFLFLLGFFLYSYHLINQKADKADALTRISEQVWKTRQGYNAVRADLFQALFVKRFNNTEGIEKSKELYQKRIESINEAIESIKSQESILKVESRTLIDVFVKDIQGFTTLTSVNFKGVTEAENESQLDELQAYFSDGYNKEYSKLRSQSTVVQASIAKEYDEYQSERMTSQKNIIILAISTVVIIMLVLTFVFIFIRTSIVQSIFETKKQLEELSRGSIPNMVLEQDQTEFYHIRKAIFDYVTELKKVLHFTTSVGESKFDTSIDFFEGNGPIAKSLIKMREGLLLANENSKIQNRHNSGLAQLNNIIQANKQDFEKLYTDVLSFLIKFTEANQGSLFVVENNDEGDFLTLKSCYAYNRKKHFNKTIYPGEGLLGMAYLEKEPVIITEVPDDYIKITSGLGEANPTFLGIFPLVFNGTTEGVLEIASFKIFNTAEIQFIEAITKILASEFTHIRITNSLKNQHRLEESYAL